MTLSIGDRRLGAILLERGLVSDTDLQRVLEKRAGSGQRLGEMLVSEGVLGEKRVIRAVEEALGIPVVDFAQHPPDPAALTLIGGELAGRLEAIPYAVEGDTLRVAFSDPLNSLALETVEDETDLVVEAAQLPPSQFRWALASFYPELGLNPRDYAAQEEAGKEDIGERLLRLGVVTAEELARARAAQEQGGEPLAQVLLRENLVGEDVLYRNLAELQGLVYVPVVEKLRPSEYVLSYLSRADALRFSALPVTEDGARVVVLASDAAVCADLEALIDVDIELRLARPADVEAMIEEFYPHRPRVGEIMVQQGTITRAELRRVLKVHAERGGRQLLGEIVTELGLASKEDVEMAVNRQSASGGRLEDTLVQSGKIDPERLARSLASQMGYEFIDPGVQAPDPELSRLVPEATARRYGVVGHRMQGSSLVVAMKDPRNVFALDDLRLLTGLDVIPAVMVEGDVSRQIERLYGSSDVKELNKKLVQETRSKAGEAVEDLTTLDDNAVVKVVNKIIRDAALEEASDIHIEPTEFDLKVRYRVDGVLGLHQELPKVAGASIAARIKIMAGLDIAERRLPQDGRVRFKQGSIDLDLRLSTLPTVYGEKIVMRLLQKASNIPEVEGLGFGEANLQRFRDVIEKPYGILLVTGPTGSGKSFTSFATLKRIARPTKNTTTVEDPVEYEIPGINQVQANPAAGMTFARALRAFLRQDPDIIFVGEIRDSETAKIATEAALTGHLVLATLHTNDAPGAVIRLDEMGVESFNVGAALAGVLAQRLVRTVCSECKAPTNADPEILRRLGLSEADASGMTLYRGSGCNRCKGSGYRGRTGIHELMVIEEPVRRAIVDGKNASELRAIARECGMITMREDGLQKAAQGVTTLEEVLAVTDA